MQISQQFEAVIASLQKANKESPLRSEQVKLSEVSIVIPVLNNQEGINRFFKHFIAKCSPYPAEVIIVDNSSATAITIPDELSRYSLSVQLIVCSKKGPASARNAGAKKAKGKWLLFLDSDCIPTQGTVDGYLNLNQGAVAYAGEIEASSTDWITKYYRSQRAFSPMSSMLHGKRTPLYVVTANCLVWKDAFERVQGFDESFQQAGGEDLDLGIRLAGIGALAFARHSIVKHHFNDGIGDFVSRYTRYGMGNKKLSQLYPITIKPRFNKPAHVKATHLFLAVLQWISLTIGYKRG